jgi:hypothetical protein
VSQETGGIPAGVDASRANIARVYDWWLGGAHNFPADRDAARELAVIAPNIHAVARANRAFLGRAVRYLAEAGIRQFLDIGSGLPANQNVHQIAHQAAPGSRVVYVDNDDAVVVHSRYLLGDDPGATIIQADLRDPGAILGHPEARRLIDFTRPVGLLLVAVVHFVPDGAAEIMDAFRAGLAPGSYLALSHACYDAAPAEGGAFQSVYGARVSGQVTARTRDQVERLFGGFTLVDPGLVWLPEWRPGSSLDGLADPAASALVGGVGKLGLHQAPVVKGTGLV